MEQFPSYMQEAFFGKDLLEPKPTAACENGTDMGLRSPELGDSESDGEDVLAAISLALSPTPALSLYDTRDAATFISLTQDEVDMLHSLKPKEEKEEPCAGADVKIKSEYEEGQLKHTEDSAALRNAILGPHDEQAPAHGPAHKSEPATGMT
ncbi:unnamed protein product, partial [Leptidea sinapis]